MYVFVCVHMHANVMARGYTVSSYVILHLMHIFKDLSYF